jgi:methylthioribulose-1-phosphate dehydratase
MQPPPSSSTQEALLSLCGLGAEFYQRGWMLATAGNLSVRTTTEPTRYAITRSGGHKGRLTPEDFVERTVHLDPPAGAPKTSAETIVHERLYASFCPGAILHVHGPMMTLVSRAWARDGAVDVSGWEYVKALGFWDEGAVVRVPVVPNHTDIARLAEAVAGAAGAVPAVLVDGHGVYAWGETIADAQRHLEACEFLCGLAWEQLRAGLHPRPPSTN